MRTVGEQVERALEQYAAAPPAPLDETTGPERLYLATPDRLAWALGWIVANQIVQARFAVAAVDVLPIFHPEHGYDRFVVTRRLSSHIFSGLPADELGRIMVSGERAPIYRLPSKKARVPLGDALRRDPDKAIGAVLEWIPERPGGVGDLKKMRRSERAPRYPDLYGVVTELILDHPDLVASREIYIDDEQIDGQFHPLHLHSVELSSHGFMDRHGANLPVVTYNWIQLQRGEEFAFVDRRGTRAVYRTERGTWARPRVQLADETPERMRERLEGWLRIGGRLPDPSVD